GPLRRLPGWRQWPGLGHGAIPFWQAAEHRKLCRARDQCREALRYVNEAVKQAENQQRLESYQKRLDASSLERTSNPIAAEFKVSPASAGQGGCPRVAPADRFLPALPCPEPGPARPPDDPRRAPHLAHQQGQDRGSVGPKGRGLSGGGCWGSLGWGPQQAGGGSPAEEAPPSISPDLQVLLLGDLLVLLQRQDERLVLKCHGRAGLGSSDPKQSFSPVLRLGSVLIRSVAT
ncbi:hypothetical protein E2320_014109, partial [Naja naja]